jgi:quinohemoprotein amine dehydrogenase
MVRLNGLQLSQEDARHILTCLAKDHGLAPEESAANRWYLEMRQPVSEPTPNPQVRIACGSCHPFARAQTWRRSPSEWKLLVNMHLGYFPVSENNSFHARRRMRLSFWRAISPRLHKSFAQTFVIRVA